MRALGLWFLKETWFGVGFIWFLMNCISRGAMASSNSPAIFIFGDSLADVGNNNYLPFTTLKSNFFPYGVDYPNRIPTGRFTNGHVVMDIVASSLGFPISSPYLSPSTKGMALLQGVNYASGGCGILNETTNNSTGCLSMSTQLKYHDNTIHRIEGQLGVDVAERFLNKSLYFVIMGSNDFLGNYIRNTSQAKLYSPSQFIDLLISTLSTHVSRLYTQHARKIALVGLGPLGCIPYIRARTNNGTCNQELNSWAMGFNIALQELVKQLGATYPNTMVTFVNPYPVLDDLIEEASKIDGINVVNEACCGGGKLNAQVPCLPLFLYCSNRTNHLFWDPWHPTEATNKLLASAFLSAENNIVGPWSISQLASSN